MKRKKRVLIIDDDRDLLELLAYRMEVNNFEVLTASSGPDALSKSKTSPDVILMDIMMPENSEGYSILTKLKMDERTKDIPVIFLTRKVEDREKALKKGCAYFITKPFEAKDLLEKIRLVTAP